METLAPSVRLLQAVRYTLEAGESTRHGLIAYFEEPPDDFTPTVRRWWELMDRGCVTSDLLQTLKSPARRHLLSLFEKGLRGEPILAALCSLDEEMQEQSLQEIEEFLGHLPFRMLLPLLFFLFPAFLVLLLGPLLLEVVAGVG